MERLFLQSVSMRYNRRPSQHGAAQRSAAGGGSWRSRGALPRPRSPESGEGAAGGGRGGGGGTRAPPGSGVPGAEQRRAVPCYTRTAPHRTAGPAETNGSVPSPGAAGGGSPGDRRVPGVNGL